MSVLQIGCDWQPDVFWQKAQLLGYPTHAAFVLEMRMAKTPETVHKFLTSLAEKLKPLRDAEMKMFLDCKLQEVKRTNLF